MTPRTLFAHQLALGEGPRWCPDGLWWVDIIAGKLFHSAAAPNWPGQAVEPTREWDLHAQVGMVGALAPVASGGLVLATQQGFQRFDPASGRCRPIADPTPDPAFRFNDGAVDPAGRLVAGTMSLDMAPGVGRLWSLECDGTVHLRLDGLTCPNGIVWFDHGRCMAFIDSPQRAVQIFAYDPESGVVGRELRRITFNHLPGVPDGCCLDTTDGLWVAFWGGGCVRRFDLFSGAETAVVQLPATQITACALAGPQGDQLVITSAAVGVTEAQAGQVFTLPVQHTGKPTAAWQERQPSTDRR